LDGVLDLAPSTLVANWFFTIISVSKSMSVLERLVSLSYKQTFSFLTVSVQ
jgi:hypothetical protein